MNLRDWLIVVGVFIIIGILLDGYRRMRLARKDSLKMSLEMVGDVDTSALDDGFNPELPGGGARVVKAGLDEVSVETSEAITEHDKLEPYIAAEENVPFSNVEASQTDSIVVSKVDSTNRIEEPLSADIGSRVESKMTHKKHDTRSSLKSEGNKQVAKAEQANTNVTTGVADDEQLVIVLNVHSQEGSFPGVEIKKLLEACGLDHGEMSIFHRHEEDDLLSPIQFSVANAVEPGYFDPETLSEIATPGVSFFMSLPGPKDYMKAFDYMLETAQCFARNLKGDLKDQDRSIMTTQTIEHCRQQVKEFERKQLSKSRL